MSKRERLELTFGEKDADLWQYLVSFNLPKAALVKKMIREHMEKTEISIISELAETKTSEVLQEKKQETLSTSTPVIEEPSTNAGSIFNSLSKRL